MAGLVYVITGASRGIGFEFVAQASSIATNKIFALCRNPDKADKLAALAKDRKNVTVLKGDVDDKASIISARESVEKILGERGVDILINNAAITMPGGAYATREMLLHTSFSSVDEQGFIDVFRTNVVGVLITTNAFIPLIKKGNEKKIINISSFTGSIELSKGPRSIDLFKVGAGAGYVVSKAALNMATRKYAVELEKDGIVVLGLCWIARSFIDQICAKGLVKTDIGTDAAPHTPETSVGKMMEKIASVGLEETGILWDAIPGALVPF
ncbi:NAD(P)-binding protein [Atractiella rhizophila]|nr:NAD(P)-binding protein [Atractiella rhizophila]